MISIEQIMENRGINLAHLKEEKVNVLDWKELKDVARETVIRIMIKRQYKNIGILYDPDVDGLFSGYTLENFLSRTTIPQDNIHRFMNQLKVHGASPEMVQWVKDKDIDELFIVDAGSSNVDYLHEELPNVRVTILDHHPYKKSEHTYDNIKLLNVDDDEELPALSGCGVVYRFVELMGKMLKINTKEYEPFVGITVLSDICDMLVPENRYYVRQAYDNYHMNGFLQQFRFYGSLKSFFGYQVIPYLNALVRCGEVDWAMKIVNNMDDYKVYKNTAQDHMRIKEKQKEMLASIEEFGQEEFANGCLVHIRHKGAELKPFNGLLANQFVRDKGMSALVLCLNKEDKTWGGSFRGLQFTNELLSEWGFTCAGHAKACGAVVKHEDLLHFLKEFKSIPEPIKEPEVKAFIEDLTFEEFMDIAQFNEMASGSLDKIEVELLNPTTEYMVIPENKRDYYKIQNRQILDFSQEPFVENLVVEASLDSDGYQLIRSR